MSTDRLASLLTFHPFTRLNALLEGLSAGGSSPPLRFSVGEPQMTPPAMLDELLRQHRAEWSNYPLAQGTPAFRAAVVDWLVRRYRLPPTMVDADRHVLPVAGTREALFMIALSVVPEWSGGRRPAVLMPNPFYHVYAGAAVVAGAEPVFLPTSAETGFLPDIDCIPRAVLERTALAYICSPANPQGAVASPDYLQRWIELARRHGFVVAFDECYAEIYDRVAPAGGLEACARLGGDLDNVVVFHSLSKRSGVPGLRSGFIAGEARLIQRNAQLINYGGVAVPSPILAASTALWRDEAHVEGGRQRYRANIDAAAEILGREFGFARPAGAFFLWLDVGDGEAAARRLWAAAGIRVLPGGYMARPDDAGANPGARYIRVALVYDTETTAAGLRRLRQVLAADGRPAESPAARHAPEAAPA
ncbi:MAG: aminotransferase class I/II-fold pyridoxal phosphate-dependent enzyme [Dongiaceae bacterium]